MQMEPKGSYHEHSTKVAKTLNFYAPSATIFGFRLTNLPANPSTNYRPELMIGSHSWQTDGTTSPAYTADEQSFDNYVYSERVTEFVAAGNNDTPNFQEYVNSPGAALNVITVGAYDPYTNRLKYGSSYRNNEILAEKPEIIMPGHWLNIGTNQSGNTVTFGGTSCATPVAAAFAAAVMSSYPWQYLRRHPEVMKALLITSTKTDITDIRLSSGSDKGAGFGYPVLSKALNANTMRNWEGSNLSHFNASGEILQLENVIPGKTYRLAIAWSSRGTSVMNKKRVSQDIDLYVIQNGVTIANSTSARNPYEYVSFVPSSSTVTVMIKRYDNLGDNVLLGYNLHQDN
jgi:hypothetical protein